MKYFFHPEAETEFNDSIEYYEECQKGLGNDFAMEDYLAIERILLFPEAWPEVEHKVRRSLIKRFPFGILYNIQNKNKSILILAVMNLYKEPGHWKRRIQ